MPRRHPFSYVSLTGQMCSPKNAASRAFDTPLALDYMKVLEFDETVQSFQEWPCVVHYRDGLTETHYTPDVLVHYWRSGSTQRKPLLVEIKSEADMKANARVYQSRFNAARGFAKTNGWEFAILTEKEIRTPFLSNARFLLPFKNRNQYDPEYTLLFESIPATASIRLADLIDRAERKMREDPLYRYLIHGDPMGARERLQAMVWVLVAQGFLVLNLRAERISMSSMATAGLGRRK